MRTGNTEHQLIAGCRRNERKYQEALYRKYFEPMMRMCMRYTKDPDIAISIVNDGFLKVFKNIDKYEERGHLKAWIQRIVYRALADHFRKDSKRLQFLVLDSHDKSDDASALPDLYMEELMLLVEQLPEMNRKVFSLFAIQGYSHREISEILDINENTSKWYLAKARKVLKERIQLQDGLTKTNGA